MDSPKEIIKVMRQKTKTSQLSCGEVPGTTLTPCPHGNMVTTYPGGEQRLWECGECDHEIALKEMARQEKIKKDSNFQRVMNGFCDIPKRFKDKTLENYTRDTKEKKKVASICSRFVEKFDEVSAVGTCMIFCGKPGTGKTHLGYAIAAALREKKVSAVVTTASDMTASIKEAYKSEGSDDSPTDRIRKYSSFDLLIVDEVGVQVSSDAEKRIFFDVINKRYENMAPTIMISNLARPELSKFIGERAMDRMNENGGVVIAFEWDSYRK